MPVQLHTSYAELKDWHRLNDDGDAWGTCMNQWFGVAAVLYFDRDACPESWRYRPGAASHGPDPDDRLNTSVFRSASTKDLVRYGNLLNRYADMLRAAGRDY